MVRRILCLVLLCGGVACAAPPVGAEMSLSVGPALLDVAASPGASGRHELTVSNTGDAPLAATVVVEPVGDLADDRSAVAWLSVSPAELHLDPGAAQTVDIDIAVPAGIDSGGRYAKVTITTSAPETSGNATAVAGQLGVGVLITVEGDGALVRTAAVDKFAPVLEADGRIGFRALVQNDGNVHLLPKGEIVVSHTGEPPLGSLAFAETTPHLPGSPLLLRTRGSLPLAPDTTYQADATLTYGEEGDEQTATAAAEFTLDPSLGVADAGVCENLDRGPTLTVDLRNDGAVGLEPGVSLAVRAASGEALGSATVPGMAIVWPQETTTISVDFPERLESGAYTLVVGATYGPAQTLTHELPFAIGGLDGNAVPLCAAAAASTS